MHVTTKLKNRSKIAVDIDDVIFTFVPSFSDYHNQVFGTNVTVEDLVDYSLMSVYFQCESSELTRRIEQFFADVDTLKLPPITGAVDKLTALSQEHELYAISSRSASIMPHSQAYLNYYLPGVFSEIYHTSQYSVNNGCGERKSDACRRLGIHQMIDDHLGNIDDLYQHGIAGVLFGDYAWNRYHQPGQYTRASGWHEVTVELPSNLRPND